MHLMFSNLSPRQYAHHAVASLQADLCLRADCLNKMTTARQHERCAGSLSATSTETVEAVTLKRFKIESVGPCNRKNIKKASTTAAANPKPTATRKRTREDLGVPAPKNTRRGPRSNNVEGTSPCQVPATKADCFQNRRGRRLFSSPGKENHSEILEEKTHSKNTGTQLTAPAQHNPRDEVCDIFRSQSSIVDYALHHLPTGAVMNITVNHALLFLLFMNLSLLGELVQIAAPRKLQL